MFEKNLRLGILLDFYSELLDEHTRTVMKAYYEDDLSLAEVADGIGISRQGVRHIIKKGEEQIEFYESKLNLCAQHDSLSLAYERINSAIDSLDAGDCEGAKKALHEVANLIQNKVD